jgi:hypothetical protein
MGPLRLVKSRTGRCPNDAPAILQLHEVTDAAVEAAEQALELRVWELRGFGLEVEGSSASI